MNDSPVDCQSRRRPRRVVRAATEPHPSRQFRNEALPLEHLIRGFSSFGRAPPCQGGGGGFEPRNPLQKILQKSNVFCSIFLSKPQVWYIIAVRRISSAPMELYIITLQRVSFMRFDDIQHFVLVICNFCEIDDIPSCAWISSCRARFHLIGKGRLSRQ